MLKVEIKGEGVPTKGVPQGGILSTFIIKYRSKCIRLVVKQSIVK